LNKHLEILAESVLLLNKNNVIPNLVFWKITTLHSTTKRLVCVYGSLTHHGYDYSPQSLYGKNVNKLKELGFFIGFGGKHPEFQMNQDQKKNFRLVCLEGDTLSYNVFNKAGREDTAIAAAQFKQSLHGVWINCFAVTAKPASKAIYGANGGFLPDETSFRGIGLAFTLLRSFN
jgi:hypothetical protein